MTKERFVYLLEFIKKHHELESNLCQALESMSPGNYIDAFVYSEYETELLKTIKEAMNVPEENDDIEYFMYDLEFGKLYERDSVLENGKAVDFSSAEALYEYLIAKF